MPKPTILNMTPAEMGYAFPPEWAPHAATWFSWPRPESVSFPGKYASVPENLARIIREITPRERVCINVPNAKWERIVRAELKKHRCSTRNIRFFHIKTNEPWCRDHGPAFVRRVQWHWSKGERRLMSDSPPGTVLGPAVVRATSDIAIVDWGFNAWGGKYPPWKDDDDVPTRIAAKLKLPVSYPKSSMGVPPMSSKRNHGRDGHATIVMEGGSVDFNGAGTILTTTDCLLNKNRNPKLSKRQIEQFLKAYYGQQKVCWLTGGIAGDDTDGHIDDLARFISPSEIVVAVEKNPKDENYKALKSVRKQLNKLRDQNGKRFKIVELPMPRPVVHAGERLPATYVNFYFVNGALLVPTYRDPVNDRMALRILQKHLPKRKVIGIDCVELIWGLGAIHCLTQQQPTA